MFDRTKAFKQYLKNREEIIKKEKSQEEKRDRYQAANSEIILKIKTTTFLAEFTVSSIAWAGLISFCLFLDRNWLMVDITRLLIQR